MSSIGEADPAQAVALAEGLLAIFHEGAPPSAKSKDRNDLFLWIAITRAFRCLRSIRDLVAMHQEADDALVLTRTLLAITLRALWLNDPTDDDERIRRGRIFLRDTLGDQARQERELEVIGLKRETSSKEWGEMAAGVGVEGGIPDDQVLARELGLDDLYSTAYRTASGSVVYSLGAALEGLAKEDLPEDPTSFDGVRIRLYDGQPERAAGALIYACVIFISLLQRSEPRRAHGMFEPAEALILDVFPDLPHHDQPARSEQPADE